MKQKKEKRRQQRANVVNQSSDSNSLTHGTGPSETQKNDALRNGKMMKSCVLHIYEDEILLKRDNTKLHLYIPYS